MANSDKDILITPSKGLAALPEISFVGSGNVPIKLKVLDDNTITFEGTSGQLFSINNNLTNGNIFSVNDVSGVPSISVNASGRIDLARYNGFVNIGPNSTATDKQLAVTGKIVITSALGSNAPAEIHFNEGGGVTGVGAMYIGYDGPNYSDNNNFFYIRNTPGTEILTATYGGGVGINTNNPRMRFHLFGGHGDTSWRITLPAANNGAGTGDISLQAWVSEPGITWDGGGIGMNVTNYTTAVFPTNAVDSSLGYFPRLASGIGQSYIRFIPNGGRMYFTTTDNNGTTYQNQIQMGGGCLGINGLDTGYRLYVGGDVNITGEYRKNGTIFTPLPQQTDATRGSYLVSDGSNGAFWAYPGTTIGSAPLTGFRYRSLFTHGFLAGGYKGSNPWRSVNKTWHATDITFYCGEQLDRAASYLAGTWSDYNAYVHGTVDSFSGSSTHTSSYNLHTGVIRQQNASGSFSPGPTFGWDGANPGAAGIGYNTWGGWDMSTSRDFHGSSVNQVGQNGYIQGGGSAATDKLHFPTEIMYTTTSVPTASTFVSGAEHEDRAWWSGNGWQGYMLFSNDSYTSQGWLPNADGWNKHLSTKWGHLYGSKGGNTYQGISKINASTGATISDFSKLGNWGEENMEMGQDKGYMLGNYNGNQNNETASINYATDVWTALGAASRPKGHYGQSSGACSSAAASVTATRTL